ncbi:MAG: pyrimidine dimer DNA glycosylase/endonuclease V, partial [Gammaproteobacteria bacterium]
MVALWREGLLAQAVLQRKTRGYRQHPQLLRFKQCRDPLGSLATYMWGIHAEARRRGFAFNSAKLPRNKGRHRLAVTRGQLQYELRHLKKKLWARDRRLYSKFAKITDPA